MLDRQSYWLLRINSNVRNIPVVLSPHGRGTTGELSHDRADVSSRQKTTPDSRESRREEAPSDVKLGVSFTLPFATREYVSFRWHQCQEPSRRDHHKQYPAWRGGAFQQASQLIPAAVRPIFETPVVTKSEQTTTPLCILRSGLLSCIGTYNLRSTHVYRAIRAFKPDPTRGDCETMHESPGTLLLSKNCAVIHLRK